MTNETVRAALPLVQQTAPERIYLTIADDEYTRDEPFPSDHSAEICWCQDEAVSVCVPYVRADLHAAIEQLQAEVERLRAGIDTPTAVGQIARQRDLAMADADELRAKLEAAEREIEVWRDAVHGDDGWVRKLKAAESELAQCRKDAERFCVCARKNYAAMASRSTATLDAATQREPRK